MSGVYGAKVQSEYDSYRFGLSKLLQELPTDRNKCILTLEELAKKYNLGFYDFGFFEKNGTYRPKIIFVGYIMSGKVEKQKQNLGNFYKEIARIFPAAFFAKIGEGNYCNSTDTEILIKDVPELAPNILLKRPYISDGFSKDVLSELEKLGRHVEFNSKYQMQSRLNAAEVSRTSDNPVHLEHFEFLIQTDENHSADRVAAYLKTHPLEIAVQSLDVCRLFMRFPQQRAKELAMSYVCMLPQRG